MSDVPPVSDPGESALKRLIAQTALFNVALDEIGWPPVSVPHPDAPIEPFFADLIGVIHRLTQIVSQLQSEAAHDGEDHTDRGSRSDG